MGVQVIAADCIEAMAQLAADGVRVHAVVTDPPYHLTSINARYASADSMQTEHPIYKRLPRGFMGKQWDGGDIAFRAETWRLCFDLLPPGGHLVAFGGTRTWHRMACAIEDAGFEIRDTLCWLYGSGFPKSHDVSKAIDKAAGAERRVVATETVRDIRNGHGRGEGEGLHAGSRSKPVYMERQITAAASPEARQWEGWGTALKPAFEPIVLARKPLAGTVAANVLAHGTGALNIDGCRVGYLDEADRTSATPQGRCTAKPGALAGGTQHDGDRAEFERPELKGRWPANVVHDGSEEVIAAFPEAPGQQGVVTGNEPSSPFANVYGDMPNRAGRADPRADAGSAARFFYSAKADKEDRLGSKHPTVKPVDLMAWLVRLVCPKGGTVLDPFAGSGTTGQACLREGMDAILIEREAEYVADIHRRLAHVAGGDTPLFAGVP